MPSPASRFTTRSAMACSSSTTRICAFFSMGCIVRDFVLPVVGRGKLDQGL